MDSNNDQQSSVGDVPLALSQPVKLLTKKQVIFRVVVIMGTAELLIMYGFSIFPLKLSERLDAFLDPVLLVAITAPFIYLWVVKPFVDVRDNALAYVNQLAHIDPLTGLANRRFLSARLGTAISENKTNNAYGALLAIDLDGFKLINDLHGHDAGDAVLVEVGARMCSVTRSEDLVCRVGGDEFLVLIKNLDAAKEIAREKAALIAEKLIALIQNPIVVRGKRLSVGTSIGVRLVTADEQLVKNVIQEADAAMYNAKKAGGGRAEVFS